MHDVEAQASDTVEHSTDPSHPVRTLAQTLLDRKYVPWHERIKYVCKTIVLDVFRLIPCSFRHFSWQWHGIVTATAVTSTIIHIFPYHNDSQALKIVALVVFLFGVVVFVFNFVCKIAKFIMFPEVCFTFLAL